MAAQLRWVNKKHDTTLITISLTDSYYAFPNYGDVPDANPLHLHIQNIFKAIEAGDPILLKELLTRELQSSAVRDSQDYGLDENGYETTAQYLIETRPFIEGLMLLSKKDLANIIQKIVNTNNTNLTAAFMESVDKTSLDKNQLFNWTQKQQRQTHKAIINLQNYGLELVDKNIPKGVEVGVFSQQLTDAADQLDLHMHCEITQPLVGFSMQQNHQMSLRTLQFKLELCELLHSKDDTLSRQRDYKKLIAGIATSLFTLFVLNIENYVRTGNFSFFSKSETGDRIDQIDAIVCPHGLGI